MIGYKHLFHWEDVNEGDIVSALVHGNMFEAKVVDRWVTDKPFDVRIGVEIYDWHFFGKHSCRGKGEEGRCIYLTTKEIYWKEEHYVER